MVSLEPPPKNETEQSCLPISGPPVMIGSINSPATDLTAIKSDLDNSKLVDNSSSSNSLMIAPFTS